MRKIAQTQHIDMQVTAYLLGYAYSLKIVA